MKSAPGARLLCALGLTAASIACSGPGRAPSDSSPLERRQGSDPTPAETSAGPSSVETPADSAPTETPMEAVSGVSVLGAARQEDIRTPVDATPSPDGEHIFFLANAQVDGASTGAIYRANADGSEISQLAIGGLLSAPVGIAISRDGETLFIADLTATGEGAILQASLSGGDAVELTALAETQGLAPRAVSVAQGYVYFTGQGQDGAGAAVYRLEEAGAGLSTLSSGSPLVAPAGVVANRDGVVYVIDALADEGRAGLLAVRDGEVELLVGGLGVGFPAGLTLTHAEDRALISGLSPETGRDVVYVFDLGSAELSTITDPVDAFAEPAGLHRAHDKDVFAWADSEAGGPGTVFILSL